MHPVARAIEVSHAARANMSFDEILDFASISQLVSEEEPRGTRIFSKKHCWRLYQLFDPDVLGLHRRARGSGRESPIFIHDKDTINTYLVRTVLYIPSW